MGNMTIATIFIVMVNVLMWFSAIAMQQINPDALVCYDAENSIIGKSIQGSGNQSILDNDIIDQLPGSEGTGVSQDQGNVFTDVFKNMLNWFKTAPGIKYIYGVVAAPYNILKCMGLPIEFVVGVGTLWYLVTFLVLISFLWGRE